MIIKVKNGAYEQYEQLLLQKDQYRREAAQIRISYTREFGDLINRVFEKKIACIRLKKTIALCQTFINRGETVDLDMINAVVEKEMTAYQEQLWRMLEETRSAKNCRVISAAAAAEIKRLYRKLAKQLHPDINPLTGTSPKLSDLWNRIVIAFHGNNLEELEELNILAAAALEKLGAEEITIEIPNIGEKIEFLEKEINEILTSKPYIFKHILDDPEQSEEKRKALEAEWNEYDAYCGSLQQTLDEMLMKTGRRVTWRMKG